MSKTEIDNLCLNLLGYAEFIERKYPDCVSLVDCMRQAVMVIRGEEDD